MKKYIINYSIIIGIIVCLSLFGITKIWGADYLPRLTAPDTTNSYYYSNKNIYYATGYGMPNCTAYAYGRVYEVLGYKPDLPNKPAGEWWDYNEDISKAFSFGYEPQVGSIACWTGHVAVVEKVEGNTVTVSQSNWSGRDDSSRAFEVCTYSKDNPTTLYTTDGARRYPSGNFQGYIYFYTPSEIPSTVAIHLNSTKFSNVNAQDIGDTYALLYTEFPKENYDAVGFYIGISNDFYSMTKVGEAVTYSGYSYALPGVYDNDTDSYRWGPSLMSGQTYYYAFYVRQNNHEYVSPIQSFTTLVYLKGISLDKTNLTLDENETGFLTVNYNPSNTTNSKTVKWSSSDTSIAVVDSNGIVTAVKAGTATITATAAVGGYVATCNVIVNTPLKGISLDKASLTLNENETSKLTVNYNPSNTTENKNVVWSSSDTSVAMVDSNGIVTAIKAGTVTITATNRATGYTAICEVTVNSTVLPLNKLSSPDGLQWDTEHFGTITWNPVEGAVSYIANLYCDGKQVIQCTIKTCKNDFSMFMFDSGNYTVEIYAVPADSSEIESSDIVRSGSLEYKVPQQKISVPVNIYWQGTVLKWDAVKDASRYEIACFLNGQRTAWGYYVGTSYDVKFYLDKYGSNDCIFKIRAISNDITKYGHSAYADTPEYDTGGTPEYPEEGQEQQIRNFVKRLYQVILNREAEEDGLNAWTKQLLAGKATGAQIVAGFVESDEFTQRGLTNEEVVEIMYQAMLGRTSDEGGMAGWSKILNNGCSYLNIVDGFSGSAEFNEICGSYGIIAGAVELNRQRDKNPQLTAFVARCYTQALDRQYETGGLEAWCDAIITGRNTPKQVAQNFIFSAEFVQKDLSDEAYVKVLYRTFMGREADEGGLAAWVNVLKSGREDRAKVLEGFSDSVEFAEILQSFGLR